MDYEQHCHLGATAFTQGFYGPGTGEITFNDVGCAGVEARLVDCPSNSRHTCNHNRDVGVRCASKLSHSCILML